MPKKRASKPSRPLDEAAAPEHRVVGLGIADTCEPGVEVGAPVAHRVGAGRELLPVAREVRRAGQPAGHADDGDPLVRARRRGPVARCAPFGHRGRRAAAQRVAQLAGQMAGERGRVGVVEHHRVGGDVFAREGAVEAVPQLHRHQRVHAEIEEADRRRRRRGQPENRLQLALDEGEQQRLPLGGRRDAQAGHQVLRRVGVLVVAAPRRSQHLLDQRGVDIDRVREHRPVDGDRHGRGDVLAHQPVEGLEALLRVDPARAARLQPLGDPLALLLRLAEPRPRAPGDGLPRQPARAPVRGELVEEGVGRRVVRLPGVAHDAGGAGEEDEEVEVAAPRSRDAGARRPASSATAPARSSPSSGCRWRRPPARRRCGSRPRAAAAPRPCAPASRPARPGRSRRRAPPPR